jgi:AraC-like DNA-binding protein
MRILGRRARHPVRAHVRSFAERHVFLGAEVRTKPLPARPDQFIEFYLGEPYRLAHDKSPPEEAPAIVVVGPQSYRRTRLIMAGEIKVFTIRFQPSGFHHLFGIDMTRLADQGVAINDVLGAASVGLREAVLGGIDFEARAVAAETWIAGRLETGRAPDAVARAALALTRSHGRLRIDAVAARAGLGDRQFTRRFAVQVGLAPKLYARTLRLNAVLAAKAAAPGSTWTGLVHAAGYADQAHFVRDCHALAGGPPTAFFDEWIADRRAR